MAYLVACVAWHDADAIKKYGELVIESLKPYRGEYIARGGVHSVLEGDGAPERLAIVEFPSLDDAKQWHESEAYRPAREIREAAATTHWIVLIESVS